MIYVEIKNLLFADMGQSFAMFGAVPGNLQFAPAGKLIHNLYEIILRLRSSRYTNNF